MDRFWIRVLDRDGKVVTAVSMSGSATANSLAIEGGNIVVPHQTAMTGK
jgi:hypothetical protein